LKKACFAVLIIMSAGFAFAGDLKLKVGDRVVIAGDSITEQKCYSRYIEDYITICVPELKIELLQLGWSGERAPDFVKRIKTDLAPFSPSFVTLFYGMNDVCGDTQKSRDEYEEAMNSITGRIKAMSAGVLVGSPGIVDTYYCKGWGATTPKIYNEALGKLSDICRKTAGKQGVYFVDIHAILGEGVAKAKEKFGEKYTVIGNDGIHPEPAGHTVIAYGFLKGMGFDGNIGTFTVDMKGSTTATAGHKVLFSKNGAAEIESSKYPFCFTGEKDSAGGTRGVLSFLPFNEELNRLTLIVKNLEWEKAKVKWGAEEKIFLRNDLEKGINLAAEFTNTPFASQFAAIDAKVAVKQAYETKMIKNFTDLLPAELKAVSKTGKTSPEIDKIRSDNFENQKKYSDSVKAKVIPVKHTIKITKE